MSLTAGITINGIEIDFAAETVRDAAGEGCRCARRPLPCSGS